MTVKFIARIPTPVQYGYLEVHAEGQPGQPADSVQAEFTEAVVYAEDYAKTITAGTEVPGATEAAVHNLQQQGVVPQGQSVQQLPQVAGPPPWAGAQQSFAQPADQQQAPQGWQPSVPPQQAPSAGPSCQHGPAKWVPPGVSKRTNQPYTGFWSCQAPQGQTKCKFN
jgi:hypothetical protein